MCEQKLVQMIVVMFAERGYLFALFCFVFYHRQYFDHKHIVALVLLLLLLALVVVVKVKVKLKALLEWLK